MSALRRPVVWLVCSVLGAGFVSSCDRERPWFAPPPLAQTGTLLVASQPHGAAIWLDGLDTGRATPDTLRDVDAGAHVVRVRRDGWAAAPESLLVDLAAQDTVRAEFTLSEIAQAPPRIVLLEAFSNVSCPGCPEMAANLDAVMAGPGYGLDRVLLVKYATNWPALLDPHYQANSADNNARLAFYQSQLLGIPTLFVDGVLAGGSGVPPDAATLRSLIDAHAAGDPGFGVAVDASAAARGVVVTVTLEAARAVERPGAVLNVALVESIVEYDVAPGNTGETTFHWIMRDFATHAEPPLPLAAGEPAVFAVDLTRNDAWVTARLGVIAFVQDPQTRAVLQAGYAPLAVRRDP